MSVFGMLKSVERMIDAVIQRVAFLALAGMIVVITMQILARVFFDALSWSEEVARYLLVWTTFLGATLAYQRGRHIAVTFAVDALPSTMRRIARVAACLVALGFFAVLITVGVKYMQLQSFQVSASLRMPMRYVYSVIPASAAIMAYYALLDLFELLFDRARQVADDEEARQLERDLP